MELINLNDKIAFSDEFAPQILRKRADHRVPLICLKPGQGIEPHMSGPGIFYIIRGRGVMTVDGKEHEISAGNMLFIENEESRGIRATDELVAFAVRLGS